MTHSKSPLLAIICLGLLFLSASSIRSQVTTATVYGTVTDAAGAQLPGAVVTITNEQTSATQSATTNDEGEFTFNFLQIGRYTLLITAGGFKEQTQAGIELAGGQRVRLNYGLEIGAITEKVTVQAETPLINAVNAEQLISHPTVEVRELPLARRDWTNLLNVGTGVEVRASGGGTGVVLNGLPPGGISLTVDGTQGSGSTEETSITSFGNFNLIKVVSLEAISEVNVTKGIVPAEYSNTLSGNIGIITKSGNNEFHGSLFENYLGRFLNARNQFAAIRPNEVFNQFGGSIGGPVIKNKLFFFGVYEGYRQRRFTNVNEQVPTAEFRAAAIASVPSYKAFFDAFPLPTQPYAVGAVTSAFIGTRPVTANDNHFVIRGDYNINNTNRVSSRYTRGRPDSLSFLSTVYPFLFTGLDDTFTTSYFRTGASYSSETRFGFNRNDVTRLLGVNLESGGMPGVGGFSFSPGGGEILASRGKGWSIEEIVAFNRGRHSIKLGGIFQHQNQTRENFETASLTYTSTADLLANSPTTVSVTFGVLPYVIKDWSTGFFIQDDFKIRPNLVINLGLRYDYFSVPTERDNRLFNREEPFGLGPLRPADQGLFNTDKNNFAPRVGAAWTVDDAGRTVVRGGFGVFYTRAPLRNVIDTIRNSLTEPFRFAFSRLEAQALGLRYPVIAADVRSAVPVLPWSGTTINPDFPNPYSMQWILSFQRQLTSTIALDTAYVGTRGLNLIFNRDINTVNRVTGIRPFAPAFGQFRHFDTSDSTSYHAWQTSVQKRFSNDFLFNVNYTWARSISKSGGDLSSLANPQDPNNIRAERGPSPFDINHRFSADFLYVLPFARMWGADTLAKRLLYDGWQFGGIMKAESGAPFNLFNPNNSLPNNSQRVDYLGGQVYLDSTDNRLQYINPAAFARVPLNPVSRAPIRPGTLGRNALRLPGFWEVDLSMAKTFGFTERLRLQLRADFFNALNHTNFSAIQTNITAATFGRFTATRGARTGQLSVRITF